MEIFVQELVNSLSVASVIILIGIGVTLIFGLTGIINFAHGELLMLGGIAVWVLVGQGWSYVPHSSPPSPWWARSASRWSAGCSAGH